jgi:hypothetical protein
MAHDLYKLDQRSEGKNAADHPVKVLLAVSDALNQPFTSKNKNAIAQEGADTDADDIGIVK